MKTNELHFLLDQLLETVEPSKVASTLESLRNSGNIESSVLTIIANAGVHQIPIAFLRGEVYEASKGDWDTSSQEALLTELSAILSRLVYKLRSNRWTRIYLIPTGHPILSLQIKTMVYRVLRLNTIDLYHKSGTYYEINLDQRAIAIQVNSDV